MGVGIVFLASVDKILGVAFMVLGCVYMIIGGKSIKKNGKKR